MVAAARKANMRTAEAVTDAVDASQENLLEGEWTIQLGAMQITDLGVTMRKTMFRACGVLRYQVPQQYFQCIGSKVKRKIRAGTALGSLTGQGVSLHPPSLGFA